MSNVTTKQTDTTYTFSVEGGGEIYTGKNMNKYSLYNSGYCDTCKTSDKPSGSVIYSESEYLDYPNSQYAPDVYRWRGPTIHVVLREKTARTRLVTISSTGKSLEVKLAPGHRMDFSVLGGTLKYDVSPSGKVVPNPVRGRCYSVEDESLVLGEQVVEQDTAKISTDEGIDGFQGSYGSNTSDGEGVEST